MEKRHSAGSVVARVFLFLVFLTGGLFLAWRLYNYFSLNQIEADRQSTVESLAKQTETPFFYNAENKLLRISLSDETLNSLLTESCENSRVLSIEASPSAKTARIVVLTTSNEKVLLNASMNLSQRGNRLVMTLSDFTLGALYWPIFPGNIDTETFAELVFDISKVVPSFCSLQSLMTTSREIVVSLNINMADFRIYLEQYLNAQNEFFLSLAERLDSPLSSLYLTENSQMGVSLNLAEDILSGIFERGSARERLLATVATFNEESYQEVLSLLETYFPQLALGRGIQTYRLAYKQCACEDVAKHYFALIDEAFGEESMHACVYYPYRASVGEIYDVEWVATHKPQNTLYQDYCEARLYYEENIDALSIFITIPGEEKMLKCTRFGTSELLGAEEALPYTQDQPRLAMRIQKTSLSSHYAEMTEVLANQYPGFKIYVRYLTETEKEAFMVYTVDESLTLRGAYFSFDEAGAIMISENIGVYADFAASYTGVNYSLFPLEEYAGESLTRVTNQTLGALKEEMVSMGLMTEEEYFVYYSCYRQWFYYETSAGNKGTLSLTDSKSSSAVSEFVALLENDNG